MRKFAALLALLASLAFPFSQAYAQALPVTDLGTPSPSKPSIMEIPQAANNNNPNPGNISPDILPYYLPSKSLQNVNSFLAIALIGAVAAVNGNVGQLADNSNAAGKGVQLLGNNLASSFGVSDPNTITYLDLTSSDFVYRNGTGLLASQSATSFNGGPPYLTLPLTDANSTSGATAATLYINPTNPLQMSLYPPQNFTPSNFTLSTAQQNLIPSSIKGFEINGPNGFNTQCATSNPAACISPIFAYESNGSYLMANGSAGGSCAASNPIICYFVVFSNTNPCSGISLCGIQTLVVNCSNPTYGGVSLPSCAAGSPLYGNGYYYLMSLSMGGLSTPPALCPGQVGWVVGVSCAATPPPGTTGASGFSNAQGVQSAMSDAQAQQPVTQTVGDILIDILYTALRYVPNPNNLPLLPYPSVSPLTTAGQNNIIAIVPPSNLPVLGSLSNPILPPGNFSDLSSYGATGLNAGTQSNSPVSLPGPQSQQASNPGAIPSGTASQLAPTIAQSQQAAAIGSAVGAAVGSGTGTTVNTINNNTTNNYNDPNPAPADWYTEGNGSLPPAPTVPPASSWLDPIFHWAPGLSNWQAPSHQSTCNEITVDLSAIHEGMIYQLTAICSFSEANASTIGAILVALYTLAGVKIVLTA